MTELIAAIGLLAVASLAFAGALWHLFRCDARLTEQRRSLADELAKAAIDAKQLRDIAIAMGINHQPEDEPK